MRCPEPDTINAFVEGRLGTTAKDRLEEHLDGCESCRRLVADLIRTSSSAEEGSENWLRQTGPLEAGDRIGRFIVLEGIGEGGMGAVYSAYDPELDRKIALKVVRPEVSARCSAQVRARTMREAQALARLAHPNVVGVFDVQEWDKSVVIAMEIVEGRDLKKWLAEAPRSWREILEMFVSAGKGLAAAHEVGLVHRDFKPTNVCVGVDGRPRVVDFGLARGHLERDSAPDASASQTIADSPFDLQLTRTGALLGTPEYMAPEQRKGSSVAPAADVYSFCLSLLDALEFRFCLQSATNRRDISRATRALPWSARSRVGAILRRGLSEQPSDRFATMSQVVERLAKVPAIPRIARRFALAVLLGLLLVGVAGFIYLEWRERTRRDLVQAATTAYEAGRFFDATETLAELYQRDPDSLTARFLLPRALSRGPQAPRFEGRLPSEIWRLALSSDGRTLAISSGNTVQLWGVDAGKQFAELGPADEIGFGLVLSPDTSMLLTSGWDNNFGLWRIRDKKILCQGKMTTGLYGFSFDGRYFMTYEQNPDPAVSIRDSRTCEEVMAVTGKVGVPAFAHTEYRVAIAYMDHSLSMWDVESGEMLWRSKGHEDVIANIGFAKDDGMVLSSAGDETVRVWDAHTGEQQAVLRDETGDHLWRVQFDRNGRPIGAGRTGFLTVWPVLPRQLDALMSWSPLFRFQPWPAERVTYSSAEKKNIFAMASGKKFRIYEMPDADSRALMNVPSLNGTSSIAFHPSGAVVAVGTLDVTRSKYLTLWDLNRSMKKTVLADAFLMTYSNEGDRLLTIEFIVSSSEALLWSAQGERIAALRHPGIFDGAFSPNGREVATIADDGTLRMWSSSTGHLVRVFRPDEETPERYPSAIAFTTDGRHLVVASDETGAVYLRDRITGRPVGQVGRHGVAVEKLIPSPSGELVLSSGSDGSVVLWRIRDGERVATLPHRGRVPSASFHPTEKLIATACSDGHARVWDFKTGEVVMKFASNGYAVQFSPDGTYLAVSDETGVRLHQVVAEQRSPETVAKIVEEMRKLID